MLEKFKNKTVLITGAGGFLGKSFLVDFLKFPEIFKEVKLIDSTIVLNLPKKFRWIGKDIFSMKEPEDADYIIHLASIASPQKYLENPFKVINVNLNGLWHLLDLYKDNKKLKSLLYFSSSEVYGEPQLIPTPEFYTGNVDTLNPRSCYAESKRLAENLCYWFNKKYQMPIKIVRPFNNYGPQMSIYDGRLPALLVHGLVTGNTIEINNPNSKRSFCYIDDALKGYYATLFYENFDVFNIGNPEEVTTEYFVRCFQDSAQKNLGKKLDVIYKLNGNKTNVPMRRCPDIFKARKILNYNPIIDVKTGTDLLIKNLRSIMGW